MKDEGYKIRDQYGVFFITLVTMQEFEILYKRKGFAPLPACCRLSSPIHLIVSAEKGNLSDIF